VNVTVIGGKGKLGSEIAAHVANFYPVRIADKAGGEPTPEATKDADIVLVIVNTPSRPWGAYDVGNVLEACGQIDLTRWRLVVIYSTVNPGDTEGIIKQMLEKHGKRAHVDFGLAYVPEFVRQGSVREDFARPDYVVAGCATMLEEAALSEFYDTVCHIVPTFMSIESAEISKVALNTFLTAKMAKAAEVAWLCQRTQGADARDVLKVIGMDKRIGSALLNAGPPPGGPCLPRDDAAFCSALSAVGIEPIVSDAVGRWSTEQIDLMADLLLKRGGKVGVVGLSFKPWHSDPTESPGIKLACALNAETYDPVIESTCNSLEELVNKCDTIVFAMPFQNRENFSELSWVGKQAIDWWGTFWGQFERFGKGLETC